MTEIILKQIETSLYSGNLQNKVKLVWAGFCADTDRNSTLIEKDNWSINIIFFVFASNTDIPDGKVN